MKIRLLTGPRGVPAQFAVMLGAALLISQPSPREQVGPMPDGAAGNESEVMSETSRTQAFEMGAVVFMRSVESTRAGI